LTAGAYIQRIKWSNGFLIIIITGASGFIGSKVSQKLAEKIPNASIIGIGRNKFHPDHSPFPNYEYVTCDLLDTKMYKKLPRRADILIHLAGDRRTFVKPDEYSHQFDCNVMMTSNFADYAFSSQAELFIFSSSVYVYSGNSTLPFYENIIKLPGENLGATKLAAESLLKTRAVSGQFKVISFRIGTVYGPGASRGQFIPQAIRKLTSKDPIAKFGTGNVKRDFIFIDDVVTAFEAGISLIGQDISFEALNVGTGISTSIRNVVKVIADIVGTSKKIEFSSADRNKNKADTDHQLDRTLIRTVLGWHPRFTLEKGLRQTIKCFDPLKERPQ
jgi:nucleoside-diphosphate-sugar epimerase